MAEVQINKDQFQALAANPNEKPVVMLNLLKFKEKGGRESYARYMQETSPFLDKIGAKALYFSKAKELLSGTETWDIVMLVQYPSRKAFLKMATDPDYLKIHSFREEALERAVLYATDPIKFEEVLSV